MYREFDSNTEPGIIQTEEKKKTGTDRRVARTKRSVRMALIKLLASKPLGEITVTELARAADINRKTFYNYYSDVSMVVDEIENEIAEDFASAIHDIDFREISREPSEIFLTLARLIEKDLEFYANVFAAEGQASLLQKIVAPLKQQLWISFSDQIGPDRGDLAEFEFLLEYAVSGMIAVYQKWFNTGRKQDIEDLSRKLSVLTFNGINGLSLL
jgi:AcrR family transcriptional regulator